MALTFGNVPEPKIEKRILTNKEAVEGHGWDNLGKRNPKAIALHRMVGTLWGTDSYFRMPNIASLTDFGLGVGVVDGAANAGKILQWNDFEGYRSGWASGPVNKPYGDGAAFVAKYGINAVNRDVVSIETSGTNQPLSATDWKALVHLCSWLADKMQVPYTSLPLNPHTGINLLIWHQEFTIGTGKTCPFQWLMDNTNRLYSDMKAFMQPYQESGSKPDPAPEPKPEPEPIKKTAIIRFESLLRTSPGFYDYANQKSNIQQKDGKDYTLPSGTTAEVVDGPRDAEGIQWWDLRLQNGDSGWVAMEVLKTMDIK